MTSATENIKSPANSIALFGIISSILGIFAMLAPGITGLSVALLLGILMVIG